MGQKTISLRPSVTGTMNKSTFTVCKIPVGEGLSVRRTSRNDNITLKVEKSHCTDWSTENLVKERLHTHTQNINPWFYICIFFPYNDTVVDAQIFEISRHYQSILFVFLNQHTLICSPPTGILRCKFFKRAPLTQNFVFATASASVDLIFQRFLFFRLHDASWIGEFMKMMNNNADLREIILFSPVFLYVFFVLMNL